MDMLRGGNTGRETCLSYPLYNWSDYYDCYGETWLFDQSYQWTLTTSSSSFEILFRVISSGRVDSAAISYGRGTIFPAVYLSADMLFF